MRVTGWLDIGFGPVDCAIDLVIFACQPLEMRVGDLQRADPLGVFWKVFGKLMWCVRHVISPWLALPYLGPAETGRL